MPALAEHGLDAARLGRNRRPARPRGEGARSLRRRVPAGAFRGRSRSASSAARLPRSRRCRRKWRSARSRAILQAVGGADYTPPLAGDRSRCATRSSSAAGDASLKRTLSGVVVEVADGKLTARREWGRDGLADIAAPAGAHAPLGRTLSRRSSAPRRRPQRRGARAVERRLRSRGGRPRRAADVFPGLYRDGTLVAAPAGVVPADEGGRLDSPGGRMHCRPTAWPRRRSWPSSADDHHFGGFRLQACARTRSSWQQPC